MCIRITQCEGINILFMLPVSLILGSFLSVRAACGLRLSAGRSSLTGVSAEEPVCIEDGEVVSSQAPQVCVAYVPPGGVQSTQSARGPFSSGEIDFDALAEAGDRMVAGGLLQDLHSMDHSVDRSPFSGTESLRGESDVGSNVIPTVVRRSSSATITRNNNINVIRPVSSTCSNTDSVNNNPWLRSNSNHNTDHVQNNNLNYVNNNGPSFSDSTNHHTGHVNHNNVHPSSSASSVGHQILDALNNLGQMLERHTNSESSNINNNVRNSNVVNHNPNQFISRSHTHTPVAVSSVVSSSSHVGGGQQQSAQSQVAGSGMRDQDLLGFAGARSWGPQSELPSSSLGVGQLGVGQSANAHAQHITAPPPHSVNSPFVPAVPSRFVTRIQRGEYVCFHALFSSMMSSHQSRGGYQFSVEDALDDLEEGRGGRDEGMVLAVKPRRPQARIADFTEWMLTWNEYMSVVAHFRPHLLPQLMRYQAIITRFAGRYEEFEDVMAYDMACRRFLANNQFVSYEEVISNSEFFYVYLRNARVSRRFGRHQRGDSRTVVSSSSVGGDSRPGVRCYECGRVGHIGRHCGFSNRNGAGGSSSVSTQSSSSNSQAPPRSTSAFRDPQRSAQSGQQAPCFPWNDHGVCNHTNCRWAHRCSHCNGNHPRCRCDKRSNSRQ